MLSERREGRGIVAVFLGHLVGFVDLRVPVGKRSKSQDWPRVPWWGKLVGDATTIGIARKDDSLVEPWVHMMRRQCNGFLIVVLQACGVDGGMLARATFEEDAARLVVCAIRRLLGGSMPELSPEHRVRLAQWLALDETRGTGRGVLDL